MYNKLKENFKKKKTKYQKKESVINNVVCNFPYVGYTTNTSKKPFMQHWYKSIKIWSVHQISNIKISKNFPKNDQFTKWY